MRSYFFRQLKESDISFINGLPDGTTIEFQNTKGLNKELIKKIKSSINIRIIGGLDEIDKPKFDSQTYYDRTIYKPMEIYKILEKIESIEINYKPDWSDLDKAMYAYKEMCDNIAYDHVDVFINGRDYNRNLLGFLRGQSVCAGISMMYKELMDRQGIRCIYQNKQHGHAWNLIEINGRLVPVDLTFDIGHKEVTGKCEFDFFGRNKDFFDDPDHKATGEKIYVTSLLTKEEFDTAYENVVNQKNYEVQPKSFINEKGEIIYYHIVPEGEFKRCILCKDGIIKIIKTVLYDDTVNEEDAIKYDYFSCQGESFYYTLDKKKVNTMIKANQRCRCFYRKDGSPFMLKSCDSKHIAVVEHDYITFEDKVKVAKLYSEDDLIKTPNNLIYGVANTLLSKKRVDDKINRFKGYVGHVDIVNGIYQNYYEPRNEEEIAGFTR